MSRASLRPRPAAPPMPPDCPSASLSANQASWCWNSSMAAPMARPMSAPMSKPAPRSSNAAIASWRAMSWGQHQIFWVFHVLRDYAAALTSAGHRNRPLIAGWMRAAERLEAAQVPLPIVFGITIFSPAISSMMGEALAHRLGIWRLRYAAFDLANIAANASLPHRRGGDACRLFRRRTFCSAAARVRCDEGSLGPARSHVGHGLKRSFERAGRRL